MQQKVTITGDSNQFKQDIDSDIAALRAMGETIDKTNRTAVNAWREEVAAQREVMQQMGATKAQLDALNTAVAGTESAITLASNAMGRSFTQISRGMFMVAGQQNDVLASSRGIVTAISASATMLGGSWAAAVAVAGVALLRFFDKADEGWKTFEADLKRVASEIDRLGPAEQMDRAERLKAAVRENQQRQDALRKLRQTTQDPIALIKSFFQMNELAKEQAAYQAEIFKIVHNQIPEKQRLMTAEAYHTTLLREQASVMKDLEAMDKAKTVQEIARAQARLASDQGQLGRLRTDIARQFPATGLTTEEGTRFGKEMGAFDEQFADRTAGDADTRRATAEGKRMADLGKAAVGAADLAVKGWMAEHPEKSLLASWMGSVDVGQETMPTHGAGADQLGAVFMKAFKETQEAVKKLKPPASLLGTPEHGTEFTVPPSALESWSKLHTAIAKVGDAQAMIIDKNKKITDAYTQAAQLYDSITASTIRGIVQSHQSGVKALKQAALEPIVSFLEGKAIEMAARALADWSNPASVALDLAAAAALTAGAAEVNSLAGGGGGGSGGSASAGGGSQHAPLAQQGIGALGAQRSGQAAMSLEIVITQTSPSGKVTQQIRQKLQRLDDRQVPVRMNLG